MTKKLSETIQTVGSNTRSASGGSKTGKSKVQDSQVGKSDIIVAPESISTPAELKVFLQSVLDKFKDSQLPSVHAMSAINFCLNRPKTKELFTTENREIARDLWLRIKQSGMQVKNPPLLFSDEDELNT